uniref:Uncharacterized protein n=1 Tax=Oryza barthii TaxID=65489 RepID=A0A0D3HBI5_9ORYZ
MAASGSRRRHCLPFLLLPPSSSHWYELAYAEAKGRVCRGHRVWQIGFGSGFRCNITVWPALRDGGVAHGLARRLVRRRRRPTLSPSATLPPHPPDAAGPPSGRHRRLGPRRCGRLLAAPSRTCRIPLGRARAWGERETRGREMRRRDREEKKSREKKKKRRGTLSSVPT